MIVSRRRLMLAAALTAPCAWSQFPGFGKKKKEKPSRSVKGQIINESEDGIRGIVQLKNTRTLDVKSFHTTKEGEYYFHGLDLNIDYQIKALAEGKQSRTRTISSFDSRTELIYNLKLKSSD